MTDVVDVDGAVAILVRGGVVALPTDTVYGVAASMTHPLAVKRLFAIKRRPTSQALPVLVDSVHDVEQLGVTWSERARRLSDGCWPGPLTIVVDVPPAVAHVVGSDGGSAGFRVPHDDATRAVLRACGPLAVTSANEHGAVPCHSAAEVLAVFGEDVLDGVLDGGIRDHVASTVVSLIGPAWRVLREGSLSSSQLALLLDEDGAWPT